jgi:hypothetical protein
MHEAAPPLRDLLWQRERAIYAARGRGDLGQYASEITPSYLAWPPHRPKPLDAGAFLAQAAQFAGQGEEELAMTLTDFTVDGDSAIIYYETHRTRLPTGQDCDQKFEVIHVWLYRDGDWRLFGGMARTAPSR